MPGAFGYPSGYQPVPTQAPIPPQQLGAALASLGGLAALAGPAPDWGRLQEVGRPRPASSPTKTKTLRSPSSGILPVVECPVRPRSTLSMRVPTDSPLRPPPLPRRPPLGATPPRCPQPSGLLWTASRRRTTRRPSFDASASQFRKNLPVGLSKF